MLPFDPFRLELLTVYILRLAEINGSYWEGYHSQSFQLPLHPPQSNAFEEVNLSAMHHLVCESRLRPQLPSLAALRSSTAHKLSTAATVHHHFPAHIDPGDTPQPPCHAMNVPTSNSNEHPTGRGEKRPERWTLFFHTLCTWAYQSNVSFVLFIQC